jgi:hypothetical protein
MCAIVFPSRSLLTSLQVTNMGLVALVLLQTQTNFVKLLAYSWLTNRHVVLCCNDVHSKYKSVYLFTCKHEFRWSTRILRCEQ